jgi:hypothetical protein
LDIRKALHKEVLDIVPVILLELEVEVALLVKVIEQDDHIILLGLILEYRIE